MEEVMSQTNHYIMETYGRFDIVFERGEGCYLYDQAGKKYIDFCAGIATNALGYNHPKLNEALKAQIDKLIHVSNLYYTEPQVKAAKLLIDHSHLDKVFFCNSGTEANEAAIKLARKWGKNQGNQKYKVITMKNSFHGRTYGSLTATGQEKYQKSFYPLVQGFNYVPFNDYEALVEIIDDETCAVMLEVIQGEGGIKPADAMYLKKVEALCKEKQVLIIIDEVQTGIGRCGALFGYMTYGIQPDIVTTAKGLGGGIPIGAMLCKEGVSVFDKGDHAATFGGNPLSTTAATVVLGELLEGGLLAHVEEMGRYLTSKLEELKASCQCVKEIRGKGLMQAIELSKEARSSIAGCIEEGVVLVGAGENVIRFVPPLIVSKEEIDEGIEKVKRCLLG